MSIEAFGDEPMDFGPTEDRVQEAFIDGARACREMLARFVEQSGDAVTANSIRQNWLPAWGADPGPVEGEIWIDAWGMTQELMDRSRERCAAMIAAHEGGAAQ